MLGLGRPIRDRLRSGLSSGGVWQSWKLHKNGRDVVTDGMLWRTAGKSARYAGELVVPEPLDAVRRHLPFQDSQW